MARNRQWDTDSQVLEGLTVMGFPLPPITVQMADSYLELKLPYLYAANKS